MLNETDPFTRETLMAEITIEARASLSAGTRYYLTDLGCSIGTVVASFVAAVLVVIGSNNPQRTVITAAVAGLPAMFTALQRVIDLGGRGQWYLSRATKLNTLARSLKYEGLSVEEAAKRFGRIEADMDRRWIQLLSTSEPKNSGE
jgi:hypothetical protein